MTFSYSKLLPVFTFISDLVILNAAIRCAQYIESAYLASVFKSMDFILIMNLSWIAIAAITKVYMLKRPLVLRVNLKNFVLAALYHMTLVLGILYFYKLFDVSRLSIIFSYGLFFFFILVERSVLFFLIDLLRRQGFNIKNILIIGDDGIAERLAVAFKRHPEYGYNYSNFLFETSMNNLSENGFLEHILDKKPDEIFLCYKTLPEFLLQKIVDLGDQNYITIKLVSDLILSNRFASIIHYENLPVIELSSNSKLSNEVMFLKRLFDVSFASVVMIMGLPIFVLLIIITKLTSKGPVFFHQQRVGKDQKPFTMYKFRSMFVNSEAKGPQLSSNRDPRITGWGRILRKSRLDEFPQFLNVLKGDMSIVGPRPERQFFIEQILLKSPNYKKLLKLKPGLTSIGQVNYGYAENVDQMCNRVRYDLLYLNNVTLVSDMSIILKTVKVMFQLKGK